MEVRKDNTSGYKGVSWSKNRGGLWIAQVVFNNKSKWLGSFKSKTLAAMFYNLGALWYHGEFASLNKITDSYKRPN